MLSDLLIILVKKITAFMRPIDLPRYSTVPPCQIHTYATRLERGTVLYKIWLHKAKKSHH